MSTAVANNNRLGRFNLVRELGRGAQGTVYLAEDPHLQRQVALKTLRGGTADELQGLLDEARAVSRLQHPNIVTLFDAEQDINNPFLVFEYVAGTPYRCASRMSAAFRPREPAASRSASRADWLSRMLNKSSIATSSPPTY